MQNIEQKNQNNKISDKLWHNMLRPDYTIPGCMFELTPSQVTKLIESESSSELNKLLNQEQSQIIKKTINKCSNRKLYPKINGRTPKDLPAINRQINKPEDLIQILHSSEYILEDLHKGQTADIVLREYIPQMTHNNRIFSIFVRSGYTLAIGQKICDHIEQEPNEQEYAKIIDIVQEIMPLVTLISPKNATNELNSFMLSLYISQAMTKITSISVYPPYPQATKIFTETQLQTYHKQIEQHSMHKSEEQKYEANQGVIPLIRTIRKIEDIKHYDMGEYLMGNQIDEQDKLEQWKQFMKEANSRLRE